MKRLIIASCLGLLAGCQTDVSDLQAFIHEVKSNTSVSIEPYPEFTRRPAFEYEGESRRNPFQRPKRQDFEVAKSGQANCPQPDFRRNKQPLERYGIDALQFKGSFESRGKRYALVQSNDGSLYRVTKGDYLGLFYGQVTQINSKEIVIKEMLPDGTGCWQAKEAKLTRATAAGVQEDV